MNKNKVVSIIIPIYNAEKYLNRCIDSIVKQSYANVEIIALNDGSTDNSLPILLEYEKNYPKIIRVINQKNMGVSKTRNKGIKLASGEYIMFMDNDDYIDPDYIEKFVSEIDKSNLDVVIGGYRRPDQNGKIIEEIQLKDVEYSKYKIVAAWAKIYRREYIIDNQIEFLNSNIGEDVHFTIQAVSMTSKIKIIPYVGYNWFYNEDSVSNTAHKNMNNNLQFGLLLEKTYNSITEKVASKNDYLEYYFVKLITWFFLYASKGADFSNIKKSVDKYFDWLKLKYPRFYKNKYIGIFSPKGEILLYRVCVFFFVKMYRFKLLIPFLYLYSKL